MKLVAATMATLCAHASIGPGAAYDRTQQVMPGMTLFWKLDGDQIHLAIEADAVGWLAFGIAEIGGMMGSDVVYIHEADGQWVAVDSHAPAKTLPITDSIQDWELVARSEANGTSTVELKRALEPCDPQDRPILNDDHLTRIVVANGGTATSIGYHQSARSTASVNFFKIVEDPFVEIQSDTRLLNRTLSVFDFNDATKGYQLQVPGTDDHATSYLDFCFPIEGEGHVVAIEAVLNPATAAYVHHIVVKGVRGEVESDCRPRLAPLDCAAFYQRFLVIEAYCVKEEDGTFGERCRANGTCESALQNITGTDLRCLSRHSDYGNAKEVGDALQSQLTSCNTTAQPQLNAMAQLYEGCEQMDNLLSRASGMCKDVCIDGCVAAIEQISSSMLRDCITKVYFSDDLASAADYLTNMHKNCGGSGSWAATEGVQAVALEDVWAWAPGSPPLVLPSDVGVSLGAGGYSALSLQVHYDNPNGTPNVVDSSGIKFYYTTTPRAHSLSILQLGDKNVNLAGKPVKPEDVTTDLVEHVMHCPSEATEIMLNGTTIHVIASFLHMHGEGTYMSTTVRNTTGGIKSQATIEYYDGGYQNRANVSFELAPGDSLTTRCVYMPRDGAKFGLASADEMCIDFMSYYPETQGVQKLFGGGCGIEIGPHFPGVYQGFEVYSVTGITETALARRFDRPADEGCTGITTANATSSNSTTSPPTNNNATNSGDSATSGAGGGELPLSAVVGAVLLALAWHG